MILIVTRPFGGVNVYQNRKLVSAIRPYMNSLTYTFKGNEEKFINDECHTLEQVVDFVRDKLLDEEFEKNRKWHFSR